MFGVNHPGDVLHARFGHQIGDDQRHLPVSRQRLASLFGFVVTATARHGSFTGAAQELGVTPAAVGQLVRSLEAWVGHPLLNRTRTGKERLTLVSVVVLTASGAAPESRLR